MIPPKKKFWIVVNFWPLPVLISEGVSSPSLVKKGKTTDFNV